MWFKKEVKKKEQNPQIYDLQRRVYLLENPYDYKIGENVQYVDYERSNAEKTVFKKAMIINRFVTNKTVYGEIIENDFCRFYDILTGEVVVNSVRPYSLKES